MDNVSTFLYLGYLPNLPEEETVLRSVIDGLELRRDIYDETSRAVGAKDYDRLVLLGEQALIEAVKGLADEGNYLVPLSGGLDSRAILSVMLRAGMRDQVTTATFGVPGQYDYELGALVAKAAGVQHHSLDLRTLTISRDGLLETAREPGAWTPLWDRFFVRELLLRFGEGKTYWSGFAGEAITGAHIPNEPSADWNTAVQRFSQRGQFFRLTGLARPEFDIRNSLPASPLCAGPVSYDDQLDFAIRQSSWVRKALSVDLPGTKTPFIAPAWVAFCMALPPELRYGQRFYKSLMATRFADLASLPSKGRPGRSLMARRVRSRLVRKGGWWFRWLESLGSDPWQNYLNLGYAIRERQDYRELVETAMANLEDAAAVDWLEPAGILRKHLQREADLSRGLMILTALDVNLEASPRRADGSPSQPELGSRYGSN